MRFSCGGVNIGFTKGHLYHAHLYHTLNLPGGYGNNRKEAEWFLPKANIMSVHFCARVAREGELSQVRATIFGGWFKWDLVRITLV